MSKSNEPLPGAEQYSFCESVTASSTSPWHIRKLDAAGLKPSGGITTPSLCGRIRPFGLNQDPPGFGGWDLRVPITRGHDLVNDRVCLACWEALLIALDGSA
jgi:hypothetical protein